VNVSNIPLEAQQYQAGTRTFHPDTLNEQSRPRTRDGLEMSMRQLQNVRGRDAPNKTVSVIIMYSK
jgi:hypothetical protein